MKNKVIVIFLSIIVVSMFTMFILRCFEYKKEVILLENIPKNKNEIQEICEYNEIFEEYYILANEKLKTLTLDEKIGQLFLVRFSNKNTIEDLEKYKFGGYLFFEKDFKSKTKKEVVDMISNLQKVSQIPLLTAVDEEGGIVTRISNNKTLVESKFKSPRDLYREGGFSKIKLDTIEKSSTLSSLGINLNLAPVVDVSTNPNDYIYRRTLGEGTNLTSIYAKTVISASKETGVSYTLKHFPGYGNNKDTHNGTSVDNRTYEDILNYNLPPFRAGIESGAEAILMSHNIVTSIDEKYPTSLSLKAHKLLRNELGFTGVIITDDLDMNAVSDDSDSAVKAVIAENNLIITTDYKNSIESVKKAVKNGKINQELIDRLVHRILAWKYYKGLL